jgi:hypothetical protein
MNDYTKLFQKSCLLQFSVKSWQCSKVIDQNIMRLKMGNQSEWLRGRKYLINPDLLGQIHTAAHQARHVIQRYSLPFPITSIYLIPKESLKLIDERLEQYKERFWHRVNEFIPQYLPAREEAKNELGELYNEDDYPEDITKRFNFEWRYLILGIPGKSSVLTPEIYEREKEKFQNLMDETRELAMMALREEFADVVGHLVNRLGENNGKHKVFKGNMFNKLQEFLEELGTRNLFQDELLKELTEQARTIISGTNTFNLQYNRPLREKIQQDMVKIKGSIDESITDMPRRKLRLAA